MRIGFAEALPCCLFADAEHGPNLLPGDAVLARGGDKAPDVVLAALHLGVSLSEPAEHVRLLHPERIGHPVKDT